MYFSCCCINEYIELCCEIVIKCTACLTVFSLTRLINSIIHEHLCKIICVSDIIIVERKDILEIDPIKHFLSCGNIESNLNSVLHTSGDRMEG